MQKHEPVDSLQEAKGRAERLRTELAEAEQAVAQLKRGGRGERGISVTATTATLTLPASASTVLGQTDLQRAALILGQLQDIVVYCDAAYRIAYVNEAFEKVFGYASAAAVGQDVAFRLPVEVQPRVRSYQQRVLAGEPVSLDWEDYHVDGSRVWIHWRCQPVFDSTGDIVGVINIGTDIDRRKRVEDQREELQKQLLQAQRLDTLGSLAGGVAHDFNNILTAINGFTELALLSGSQAEARSYHERVLKACERARHLVKRILSFSRFHEPERQWVRLRELLDETSKFIRAALPSTIELAGRVDADCPPTLADPHQINQVLLNLVTNAAHAIGDHKGRIEINLRREILPTERKLATGSVAAGSYAVIDVSDTGHGMDAATQAKIFDPFFTTKREGEGTGLGLSVVSGILQGHAGGAAVRSDVGQGTTVSVYLPLLGAEDDAIDPPGLAPLAGAKSPEETIAILDDEEPISLAAEKLLQGLGYRTRVFRSGSELLRAFDLSPPDFQLILTDHTMPGLTGVEVALRLREKRYDVPIIIMTGFSSWLNSGVLEALEDVVVIKKPFGRAELGRSVREMLDRPRRRSAPSKP